MNPELVEGLLKASGANSILEVNSVIISDFVMESRSYDVSKFSDMIDNCPQWAAFVATHIYVDHVLDTFLNAYCARPEAVNPSKRRMSVLDKSSFLYGVGVLSEGTHSSLKKVNSIRNKFAHELSFEVTTKEISEYRSAFTSCYPERLRSRKEYLNASEGKVELKILLKLAVLFLEEERLAFMISTLRRARSEAELQEVLALAQRSLQKT